MPRPALTFALTLLLALFVAAPQAGATSGIKAGVNVSTMYNDDYTGNKDESLTGFNIGVFSQHSFLPFLGLQSELLYSQKGFKVPAFDATFRFHYIELPVLLRALLPLGFVKPHVEAGLYAALLVAGKVSAAGTTESITGDMNRFDWGLCLGGGVDLELGKVVLTADLRWSMGLRNTFGSSVGSDLRNGVIAINVGLGF